MHQTQFMSDEELLLLSNDDDLYFNKHTFLAASLACGGVIQCVDHVTSIYTKITRAIALVRPPGHHAERDEAQGFCYFNNVAVAAKYALHSHQAGRVFILDWDIHHGNGIQDLTYDDPNIFYLSIHRGSVLGTIRSKRDYFYPGTGRCTDVGDGDGLGANLNIVWGQGGMSNAEYAAAFTELVLPKLQEYQPDLILIACGLDAAKGDLLGDCGLTPDMYYNITKSLLEIAGANVPIVAVLEGGYNLDVSAKCMEQVALALLDEPSDGNKDEEIWSASTLLPLQLKRDLEKIQEFGLYQYWGESQSWDQLGQLAKSTMRTAATSIKKSAKAMRMAKLQQRNAKGDSSNQDHCDCSHFLKNEDLSRDGKSYCLLTANEVDDYHRPIKKRKVPTEVLLSFDFT